MLRLAFSFLAAFITTLHAAPQPIDEALPLVGTSAHGHSYPGATMPFGFVQLSPDTPKKGWDGCAGYHFTDTEILGFSHTHLSGTGIGDLGDISVMPVIGELRSPLEANKFKSSFSHDEELAQPGYYKVQLGNGVLAELTATDHAGMHRYTFPSSAESHIVIDLVRGINNRTTDAALKVEGPQLITGMRTTTGWHKSRTMYFALEASQPWSEFGLEADGQPLAAGTAEVKNGKVRAHLDFQAGGSQPVILRVGLSATSVEDAKKNLQAEIPAWDFDAVRTAARAAWSEQLSRITIESANPNIRETFYSALYHTMTSPTLYNNADGSFRGPDGQTHPNPGFPVYSTFSLWDTFRAEHPLLTLIQPGRVDDFVKSLLTFYELSADKSLPMWTLADQDTLCMIGYHAVPVIADAYAKGFRNFDAEKALEAMKATALNPRNLQGDYAKLGYVPAVTGEPNKAAARTLEYAFDDWCIAQLATALGKKKDAEFFTKRAENYANVFDQKTGFFRGKQADGKWREPFDPKEMNTNDYVEGNAWQYTFAVFHDVPGMIQLYGGDEAFTRKLDELFDQDSDIHNYVIDASGLSGQYAHGNEPCHHVAYLYALAGKQYKTALRVQRIMRTEYDNTPAGICGNDDCGQMSAWYVWSALGLYPLNPADGRYVIGSPAVEKATIRLDPKFYKGGTFTILARNTSAQNIYVQTAKLNGQPLKNPWITHQDIANGGTLEFEMGVLPNKVWGGEPVRFKQP